MARLDIAPQEWFSAAELAERALPGLPATKRGVQMLADREGWARQADDEGRPLARTRKGRGGGTEYHLRLLPASAQERLALDRCGKARAERPDRETVWMRYERVPDGMRAEAARRLEVVATIEDLVRAGLGKEKALTTVVGQARRVAMAQGVEPPYGESTVRGWFSLIAGVDPADRLAYLVPNYVGRTRRVECTREAFDLFASDYLRLSCPTYEGAYQRVLRAAAQHGWTVPSAKSLKRRLDAEFPQDVQLLCRKGPEALAHAYPHMDRSRAGIGALQIVNLDGHTWDNLILWPDDQVSRPLSLAVQDIASGKILAIRFDRTLNQHMVRLALADVFRDHGLPDTVLMDNGRENTAASISGGYQRLRCKLREGDPAGLLKSLGIKAVFATPYWGQAKPIERAFRDFAGDIAKHPAFEGSYTGKDTASKPANYGQRAIPIAEFEARVREELVHYNARKGRTGAHMGGRSFDEVYAALVERMPPRKATPEQLRMALLASEPVSMNDRDGAVKILGHRYWSQALAGMKRQRVIVRFDPEVLANPVHIYSLDGRYLCEAPRTGVGGFDSAADAQAHGRERRRYQKATRDQAEALRRLTASGVAAALPAPASAPLVLSKDGKVVRPAFGAPRNAEQAAAAAEFNDSFERGIAHLRGA